MRIKKWIPLLALCLSCSAIPAVEGSAFAVTPPENRFASNPRAVKDIGDPHVIKVNDEYFMFATGGPIGFNVWRSKDLITFTKEKALKKVSWVSGDYWAPEVYEVNGRYIMYFTGREKQTGSLRIGVAVSEQPQGPYEDPIGKPLFDFGYAAIDGTLIYDNAGIPYMIYSRDCSENVINGYHESHLYGVQLSEDLLSTVGDPVHLTHPDVEWELVSGDYRWNEGPAVLKHEGCYYLFYSSNFYASKEYAVGVAVADHPLGPYTKQSNNPILQYVEQDGKVLISGPGHNSFFAIGDEIFTSYHTHTYPQAPSGNRQLCIDRVGFHHDGTAYINGPTLAPRLRPLEDIGLVNHMNSAVCASDEFRLLIDGDTCQSASSSAYVFGGNEALFTWANPVASDMLLIYPALGSSISGQAIINNEITFNFNLSDPSLGESACITFDPVLVSELRVICNSENSIGEIMLLGNSE